MRLATLLVGCLAALLLLNPAYGQGQRTARPPQPAAADGSTFRELSEKFRHDPARFRQALEADAPAPFHADVLRSQAAVGDYIARSEREPNNFFNTADNLNDVLALPGVRANATGKQVQATLTPGDVDVYRFTVDPTKLYYFASTHSFLENGQDGLEINARIFHESDLDTVAVTAQGGVVGNDKMRGDITGRDSDGRNGSGDFRLTGWSAPINPATGQPLGGDYYLWVYNREAKAGSYLLVAYAVDKADFEAKSEPNQTFIEALLGGATLPTDGVVRSYMLFNADTVRQVTPNLPQQGNSVYPLLLEQGSEDADYFLINGKAGHTLTAETLPFFGYYRDNDGSPGPGGSRLEDTYLRLWNADATTVLAESDDDGRERMDGPGNIHGRIVYTFPEDGLYWLWAHAWASTTREPGRSVDNSDPGRAAYDLYATMVAPTLTEAEPNDTNAEATPVGPRADTTYAASFSSSADADVYRVYLHKHRMYTLFTREAAGTGDLQLQVVREFEADAAGTLATSGPLPLTVTRPGGGNAVVGGFVPPETGAYLVRLTGSAAGTYRFGVVDKGQIYDGRIANEPDNVLADALTKEPLGIGPGSTPRTAALFPAGDVDHYYFDLLAGQAATLTLRNTNGDLVQDFAGEITLLGPGGAEIETSTSSIAFTPAAAGQYVLRVRAVNAADVGFYTVSGGDPVREQEPNNTPENATVLVNGFIAATATPGDVDYYRVAAKAGQVYHLRRANSDLAALNVDLFDAANPTVSLHDGSGWATRYSSNNFKIQLLPKVDTDYLIRLEWPATNPTGGVYEIHIKNNDITALRSAFEPNNTAETATPATADGLVRKAMLYNAADDAFRYDLDFHAVEITDAGKTLVCETLPFDGPFWGRDSDMYAEIRDAAGTIVAENDDAPVTLEDGSVFDDWHSRATFAVTTPGTYYCVFRSQDFPDGHTNRDPTTGEYKFRISYLAEEAEPNNDFAQATALAPQGRLRAAFADGSDVDIYRLDLQAGFSYQLRTFRSEGMDSFGVEGAAAQLFLAPDLATPLTDTPSGSWRTRNNGSNLKLNLMPTADGTYYLRIPAPANLGEGTYEVLLKATPLDPLRTVGEPNNTFDEAAALPANPATGEAFRAMLYNPAQPDFQDDLDIYTVNLTAGDVLRAETLPHDGSVWPRDFDAFLYLYGPARQLLADNDDNAVDLADGEVLDDWHSKIEWTAQESGLHYVMVISEDAHVAPRNQTSNRFRDPARGEYQVRLTRNPATAAEDDGSLPTTFALEANYPNPFNPTTTLRYQVPQAARVTLTVYNLMGQQVAVLADGLHAAGAHTVAFDGSGLASGLYLYQLRAEGFVQTRKMMLVK